MKLKRIFTVVMFIVLGIVIHILTKSIVLNKYGVKLILSLACLPIIVLKAHYQEQYVKYRNILFNIAYLFFGYLISYKFV